MGAGEVPSGVVTVEVLMVPNILLVAAFVLFVLGAIPVACRIN